MRIGQVAFSEGDFKEAHKSWQKAAMLQPDNEEVWIALLRVLTSTDDSVDLLQLLLPLDLVSHPHHIVGLLMPMERDCYYFDIPAGE